jgi:hypothetical protein
MADEGFATAETAVLLPVLVLLLALGATVARGYRAELALQDAAKVAARSIARGDDRAEALRLAHAAGPPGADVTVGHQPGLVDVEATARLSVPAALRHLLPDLTLHASAVALDEQ